MPKKEVTKSDKKEKKQNKHFFKDFKAELKRVIWPSPKQLVNNTIAVIVIVLITAVIVFALDFIFELTNNYSIDKIKGFVETHTEQNADNNEEEQTETDDNSLEKDSTENVETESNTVNE